MNNNKLSKETFWAIGIIVICILTGTFLYFKTIKTNTDTTSIFLSKENITISEINSASSEVPESFPMPAKDTDLTSASDFDVPFNSTIDFEALWEINKDVYAWISIPGTVIDYPILQHESDNAYYLNYTIDGIEGYPGSIYTENVNSKDFTDNNTVIYGHNMRNGTMFTDLHKFRDSEFFKEHDTVYIDTPSRRLTYKIFATYLYDDRHLMNSFDFSNLEVYTNYLSEILNMKSEDFNIRTEIKVTNMDKIITLITCIREQPEKRVYVQAVLQQESSSY